MKSDVAKIAQAAGVSTATVSRVLNDFPGVRPETRERVGRMLAKMGYQPEGRGGRTVGLLLNGDTGIQIGPYDSQMLQAITRALSTSGFPYEMMPVGQWRTVQARAMHAAVALTHGPSSHSLLAGLAGDRLFGINMHLDGCHHISSDHQAQMRLAVDHLSGLGHRKALLLQGTREGWGAEQRASGFKKACRARAVTGEVQALPFGEMKPWCEARSWGPASALVAVGEEAALPLMAGLQAAAVKVPDEISVILLESPWITAHLSPVPTVVVQNVTGIADALVAALQALPPPGKKCPALVQERVQPGLRAGLSTARFGGNRRDPGRPYRKDQSPK